MPRNIAAIGQALKREHVLPHITNWLIIVGLIVSIVIIEDLETKRMLVASLCGVAGYGMGERVGCAKHNPSR